MRIKLFLALLATLLCWSPVVSAQTGVDDDRVSLPEGPGSLEGVGDDVELDPNMGSMSHSVAIELPSGFPGASPSLGLSYSSSAGSGPVGIGWSMSVPAIERMTSRGVPEYDTDDLFDMGGQELVQVGTDSGDLIYRSRFEKGFSRYRWVNAGGGADGYWVEEHTDGGKSYYGADSSGAPVASARMTHPTKGTAAYKLVEKVDVYGNAVRYSYSAENGTVPLLTGIEWIKDGSGTTVYSVEIDYESRTDLLSDATRGYEEVTADRVRFLRVKNGAEIIREYVLTYQSDTNSGGFSRLSRVEKYGLGGRLGGPKYEIVQSFEYSQALGVECTGNDCDTPYLTQMGSSIGGASGFGTGRATLLDINKDGLPDIVDTTDTGAHQFYINTLLPNHTFSSATASSAGTGSSIQLGGTVQTFDVNGDGTSDLLNTTTGQFLLNAPGTSDWGTAGTFTDVSVLQSLDLSAARFIDLDDDKRVDLITSTSTVTTFYRNEGDRFVGTEVDPLGVPIQADSLLQFADMNGDGLNDPVELQSDGSVRYRLNLGLGNWSDWRTVTGLSINVTQRPFADLEDINGDGISDVVIAGSGQVEYAINRNGSTFDAFVTLTSSDINGTFPDRGAGVTVLYADMNGNGSEDVVWFRPGGVVEYLELFPVRPNLLTRIENGIGSVQKISYTTAAQEAAEAADTGEPWTHKLSIPMQMVKSVDRYVTLTGNDDGTGLHEITMMSYRDGFYDGDEKQYRGFERVEQVVDVDGFQEESKTAFLFDVGRNKPHHNGLQLEVISMSDGDILNEASNTYEDCALAEVPTPSELEAQGREAIYFPCQTSMDIVHKERLTDSAAWKTVRTEMAYDGYGNVTLHSQLGEVGVEGDELYTETTYVTPSTTWLIGLPAKEQVYADPNGPDRAETITYYDGDDFVGLAEGQATHGFVSRVTKKVDNAGAIVTETRARRDDYGNSVETLDPNGDVSDATEHRRSYTYDETGLFLTLTDLHLGDYVLRRDSRYERNFQKVVEVSKWYIFQDGAAQTGKDANTYRYDDFGRLSEVFKPGDPTDKPSEVYAYELGDPFSRVVIEYRSESGGILDEETLRCFDGKGRQYQERVKVESGQYQVSALTVFNARGKEVEVYQPYLSTSDACETAAPSGTLKTTLFYDGMGRVLENREPGEVIYGEVVTARNVYTPLVVQRYDGEDTADGGSHQDTPTLETMDGLDRLISVERTLGSERSGETLFYDSTGTFAGYEDADGNRHELVTDLMGRTVQITNPSFGTIDIAYDDASNILTRTDARGVTVEYVYDGQNRIVERFSPANRDATLITWHYDTLPDGCELTECTNTAGLLAAQTYPVDLGGGRVESGIDRFGYDARRRNVFSGRRLGLLVDLVTQRAYDNRNRITEITHPDGTVLAMGYDDKGRLTSVAGYLDTITYEERGFLESLTFANGASNEMRYDVLMRLSGKLSRDGAGNTIFDLNIDRNRANAVTAMTDAADSTSPWSVSYTLDDWYRATAQDYAGGESLTVALDALDRITSATGRGDFSYDSASPLRVTAAGSLSLSYDAAGQLTSRGGADFTRDHLGRLVGVEEGGVETGRHLFADADRVVQMTADGTLVLYGFERFEVRDGVATTYVYAAESRQARHQSLGMAALIYPDAVSDGEINAGDAYVARAQGDESLSTEHVLAASAARLLADNEDAKAFFHADHLNSVLAATDEGGEVRGQQGFDALGGQRFAQGYVDSHGFTNQELDVTTGLYHMRFRELDPATGRWDRFDPYFEGPDAQALLNQGNAATGYAYVANRTSSWTDPSGLKPPGADKAKAKKGMTVREALGPKKSAAMARSHPVAAKMLGMSGSGTKKGRPGSGFDSMSRAIDRAEVGGRDVFGMSVREAVGERAFARATRDMARVKRATRPRPEIAPMKRSDAIEIRDKARSVIAMGAVSASDIFPKTTRTTWGSIASGEALRVKR